MLALMVLCIAFRIMQTDFRDIICYILLLIETLRESFFMYFVVENVLLRYRQPQ